MEQVFAPVETQPAYVFLDRVDVGLVFLGRVRIVETQIASPAEFRCDTEIQTDRFGMTNMQKAVWFRREARHNLVMQAPVQIGADFFTNEIVRRDVGVRVCEFGHGLEIGLG